MSATKNGAEYDAHLLKAASTDGLLFVHSHSEAEMNSCNTYKGGCWRDDLKIWDSGITNMRLGISDYFPAMTKTHGSLPLSGLYVKYHEKTVRPKCIYIK